MSITSRISGFSGNGHSNGNGGHGGRTRPNGVNGETSPEGLIHPRIDWFAGGIGVFGRGDGWELDCGSGKMASEGEVGVEGALGRRLER